MNAPLTELELNVLLRVEDGVDPWKSAPHYERIGRSDSRRTSQTLGRLERKGFVECINCVYSMTLAGREALTTPNACRTRPMVHLSLGKGWESR